MRMTSPCLAWPTRCWLGGLLLSGFVGLASAAPVTNADVIKLLEAGMPEDVVLQAIVSGQPKFDTSSDALVKLKTKGATPAILKAVLGSGSGAAAGAKPAPIASAQSLNPEEVLLVVNGQESPMQYIIPSMRTAVRGLGFGGVASYATLSGSSAARRAPGQGLEFIVSVPRNAQVPNYVNLASFAVRKNGTREVSTGGGYMSYSTGINKDRVVAIRSEPLADQSRAREGFVLHRLTPEQVLPAGEYALVLYTAEVRVVGFFAQAANSFFDFGVD